MNGTGLIEQQSSRGNGVEWGLQWLALLLALVVLAAACTPREDVPPLERRAQEINKGIMCPVCPGESIDQSQNPLAKQMRALVTEKLQEGWTEEEIRAFFVERYGPSVLMEPPRQGFNLLAWVLPPVAVLGAGIALFLALRLMRRPTAVNTLQGQEIPHVSEQEREGYFSRIEALLENEPLQTPGAKKKTFRDERKGATDG